MIEKEGVTYIMETDLFKEFMQSFEENEKKRNETENRLRKLIFEKLLLIEEERKLAKNQKADIIMYTNEFSMSVVDPTYIHDKVIGGIKRPKLSTNMPKDRYGKELGLLSNGQVIYEKTIDGDWAKTRYIYKDNMIFKISDNESDDDIEYYEFDENRRIRYIQRGTLWNDTEMYEWLTDDIAIVEEGVDNPRLYLMIKKSDEVQCIFQLYEEGYITRKGMRNMLEDKEWKVIDTSDLPVKYVHLLQDGHRTEHCKVKCLEKEYIGLIRYMMIPKGFNYSKAKKLFKENVLKTIEYEMKNIHFQVKMIGIQYMNEGYDIDDVIVGFHDKEHDEILSMKKTTDVNFDFEQYETIQYLSEYIRIHEYFNSFRKLMIQIQKEIESLYHVEVLLDEMSD